MSDPYLYEKTNVLKNLLDIKNEDDLETYENTVVNLSLLKLINEDFIVTHTNDLFEIHKRIFSNVYEWAGKPRIINIEKSEAILNGLSVQYEDASNILKAIKLIHNEYYQKSWKTFSSSSLIYEISRYISSLWKIHPFREGNTRTLTTFLYFFLKTHNYTLDEKLLKRHAAYFRNALVMASLGEYSEYQYLENILNDAIIVKTSKKSNKSRFINKYEKIKDYDMKEYKYNYHQHKSE